MVGAKVEIKTDGVFAKIYINGEEIKNIRSYTLEHSADGFPLLKLELINSDSIFIGDTVDCKMERRNSFNAIVHRIIERIKKLWNKDYKN